MLSTPSRPATNLYGLHKHHQQRLYPQPPRPTTPFATSPPRLFDSFSPPVRLLSASPDASTIDAGLQARPGACAAPGGCVSARAAGSHHPCIPHCDILLFSETLMRLASLIHLPALIHSPIRTSTYPLVLSFCDFVVLLFFLLSSSTYLSIYLF